MACVFLASHAIRVARLVHADPDGPVADDLLGRGSTEVLPHLQGTNRIGDAPHLEDALIPDAIEGRSFETRIAFSGRQVAARTTSA